ncbi:MAG: hypothetical protein R3C19_06415 [Planctomycetaceae bacterium]
MLAAFAVNAVADPPNEGGFRVATFSADVTVPIGHRCMGVLPTKVRKIADPLEAHGFVLLGADKPIVVVAVDWCEIRNGAYDEWRDALAAAAGTVRGHVLVTSLHQHDAPVADAGAAALLAEVGLKGELYDEDFHAVCIERVAAALRQGLESSQPVTHVGTGKAPVENIASNRRVVMADGRVTFDRGSRSGADEFLSSAPVGEIDPDVRTLSFWNGDKPLVALSVYATHPMSYYGQGEVSADFVGLARRQRQRDLPGVMQIYASGCSGDVTAGKYNDGSEASRVELTNRLHAAMTAAWDATTTVPLTKITFRSTPLQLEYYRHGDLEPDKLRATLADETQRTEDRILAAMGLSNFQRASSGQPIDVPCIDFGNAQLLLFPGESFVGYQLMAQQMKPDSFVVSVGYGECWPGYIPTESAFADSFHDKWLWVAPGSERRIQEALKTALLPSGK